MTYIIRKGTYYCHLNERNGITKTQDISMATQFTDRKSANEVLNKATKKLKGFQVVEMARMRGSAVMSKSRRKIFLPPERVAVYDKSKGRCALCGEFVPYGRFTMDHIVPLAKGGSNELENIQCTCELCNRIKQDVLPDFFLDRVKKIMVYQMSVNFDEKVWKKIKFLKKLNRRRKWMRVANILSAWRQALTQ